MPTRRALLRTGGAAALAALAGCQSVSAPFRETTQPESSGEDEYRLDADPIAPSSVQTDSTVGVASPDLHELVADAAEADGRVDLRTSGSADRDETLVFGEFEYLAFDGETYEPTASFAGFGEESTAEFSLLAVDDDEVGDDADIATYESLSDREQAVADDLLANGSISVGRHERRPEGIGAIVGSEYVRVDGQPYRTQSTVGDPPAHHMLRLDPADLSENTQAVTVLDEPPAADWSGVLQEGLGAGSVGIQDVAADEALVAYLRRVDYVVATTQVLDVSVTQTVQ